MPVDLPPVRRPAVLHPPLRPTPAPRDDRRISSFQDVRPTPRPVSPPAPVVARGAGKPSFPEFLKDGLGVSLATIACFGGAILVAEAIMSAEAGLYAVLYGLAMLPAPIAFTVATVAIVALGRAAYVLLKD